MVRAYKGIKYDGETCPAEPGHIRGIDQGIHVGDDMTLNVAFPGDDSPATAGFHRFDDPSGPVAGHQIDLPPQGGLQGDGGLNSGLMGERPLGAEIAQPD